MSRMSERNYAELAEDSYRDRTVGSQLTLGDNQYRILQHVSSERNGYAGTIYQDISSRQIIVAHRGTNDARDAFTDVQMVTHRVNSQATDALRLTDEAVRLAEAERQRTGLAPEVSTTGHSLGGTLSQYTAFRRDLPGRSFNGYGAVEIDSGVFPGMREGQNANAFKSYYRITDPVGTGGRHYGESIPLATPRDISVLRDIGGYSNRRGGVDVREPFSVAVSFGLSAHSIGAFIRSEGGNPPTLTAEARQLARDYDPMADKYRDDVRFVRETLGLIGRGLADAYQRSGDFAREFRNSIGRGLDTTGDTLRGMRDSFLDGVQDARERLRQLNPFRRSSADGGDPELPGLSSVREAFARSGIDAQRVPRELALGLAVRTQENGGRIDFATLSRDGKTAFGVAGRSIDDPSALRFSFNARQESSTNDLLTQRRLEGQQANDTQLTPEKLGGGSMIEPQRRGPQMA